MIRIPIVDLKTQYQAIKSEIDLKIQEVLDEGQFIKGEEVSKLEKSLAEKIKVKHCISCANGTDALYLALLSLNLNPGDEVITPAFSYFAATEVLCLLNLKPLLVDVDPSFFEMDLDQLEKRITDKTKAIIPVHLFGLCNNMEDILAFAKCHNLIVIEDNAQSLGSSFCSEKTSGYAGSFGLISTTSFFPSKNLGCYGDGGAVFTNNDELAQKLRMLSNHGQRTKYKHELIGINSRLDTLQAGILNVKLKYLDDYIQHRRLVAQLYDKLLNKLELIGLPAKSNTSLHIYHQYTIRVKNGKRDQLKEYLENCGISTMIYYPIPIHHQPAIQSFLGNSTQYPVTEQLCQEVLSLPIHSHLNDDDISFICDSIKQFFSR